jgi:type I restriction enzyme, S subunit
MNAPTGWQPRRLTELAAFVNGYAFKPEDWENDGLPIIRIEQLKNPDGPADHFGGKLPSSAIIDDGDLIFSWSASLFLRIWQHGRAALNQHLFKVIEHEGVDRSFLKAFIEFYLPALTAASHGSTMQHITRKELDRFRAPFPESKPEQTAIAEVLSKVDHAIEHTEVLIAKQQRVKKGLMQDLLTRGIDDRGSVRSERTHQFKDSPTGKIPAEWRVATLGDVIGPIVSGWSPTCEPGPASPGEWAILKTTAVVWAGYDQNENKRLPVHLRGVPSIEVRPGDILITRKGPVERVGVVVHVDDSRSQLMIPDTVFRTRVFDEARILPAFLPLALGSAAVQSDWFQKKIGLADAQVNLNHSILRTTIFPEPPLAEQKAIVRVTGPLSHGIMCELDNLGKLKRLKAALMQDLLTGKRRVTPLLASEAAH